MEGLKIIFSDPQVTYIEDYYWCCNYYLSLKLSHAYHDKYIFSNLYNM